MQGREGFSHFGCEESRKFASPATSFGCLNIEGSSTATSLNNFPKYKWFREIHAAYLQ